MCRTKETEQQCRRMWNSFNILHRVSAAAEHFPLQSSALYSKQTGEQMHAYQILRMQIRNSAADKIAERLMGCRCGEWLLSCGDLGGAAISLRLIFLRRGRTHPERSE